MDLVGVHFRDLSDLLNPLCVHSTAVFNLFMSELEECRDAGTVGLRAALCREGKHGFEVSLRMDQVREETACQLVLQHHVQLGQLLPLLPDYGGQVLADEVEAVVLQEHFDPFFRLPLLSLRFGVLL